MIHSVSLSGPMFYIWSFSISEGRQSGDPHGFILPLLCNVPSLQTSVLTFMIVMLIHSINGCLENTGVMGPCEHQWDHTKKTVKRDNSQQDW